jgi:ABC-2 type transport system ATP-binding protein
VRAEFQVVSRFDYDIRDQHLESRRVSDSTAAIAIHELQKVYRHGLFGRKKIPALKGVSLEVPPGEVFGLLGPNGAGKTTLIKVLLGIVRKTSGAATLLGRPAGNRRARRQVGYLPEHHRIPHHLTGDTALEYYGSLSGMSSSEIRRRRPELLQRVGLSTWGKTPVKKYSKGMLQRLGLAQAMLHDPQLLILDEPTDGVDPVGRAEIRDVLNELRRQGKTVFLNSHLLQEVELICDRVAILDRGRMQRVGRVDEITGHAGAEALFTVRADEAAARAALAGFEIVTCRPAGSEHVRIEVLLDGQETLDRAIDALRKARVSIAAVTRPQVTLEQAFLKLVQENKGNN